MKALSIRQPWTGAVALGWKPVENRSRMISHRGLVLIHAAQQLATDYASVEDTFRAAGREVPSLGMPGESPAWAFGAIVGVVDLTAAHRGCDGSCAPGWAIPGQVHHMLKEPMLLRKPVPCPGRLGVWTPDDFTLNEVKQVWPR